METVKIKYLGENDTLIRKVPNGEKVDVKKGDVVEVEKKMAMDFVRVYKNSWVLAEKPKMKNEMKIEGGLDEDKVEKAATKKAK